MSEYHFPVPGAEGDKIIIYTRRHWASLLGVILLVVATTLIPLVFFVAVAFADIPHFIKDLFLLGAGIYYLVLTTFSFSQWVSYYYDVLIVTDDEIIEIDQEGFFDRKINQISLLRIQDVSSEIKGLLPTIFAYGDVIAESAGEHAQTYVIKDIPNPMEVANRILELHNERVAKEERIDEVRSGEGDLRSGTFRGAGIDNKNITQADTSGEDSKQDFVCLLPDKNDLNSQDHQEKSDNEKEGSVSKEELDCGVEIKL